MKHIYQIEKTDNACVAFGRFDGMHRGHRSVVQTLVREAKSRAVPSVLVSFVPPEETFVYTSEEEKEHLLKDSGLDVLISCSENEASNPVSFIKKTGASCLVYGDYRGNKDDCEQSAPEQCAPLHAQLSIRKAAQEFGIPIVVCERVCASDDSCAAGGKNGKAISMEMLDRTFERHDFDTFSRLCGCPYMMIGEVLHGKGLGKTVGMPTANLGLAPNKKKPPEGVYATLTRIDGEVFKGLTNIGRRPSVDNGAHITVETFLLDFSRDIYGKKIELNVCAFIRNVKKFAGLGEVQKQVQKDSIVARSLLADCIWASD
ncbi:riboflavin kinase [Treponema lecithinolyticum]|uniref:riboflavin kinase n=1 Tax=Treponema lecithinolyticum TaxID=53418 RepID=UPI0028EF9719|nr:riboflavin kinase [Treponema lecithinolyticum]